MKAKLIFLCMMAFSILETLNASAKGWDEGTTTEDPAKDVSMGVEEGAIRVTTNYPDFKIKLLRCRASGNTCILDMTFENLGTEDVDMEGYKSTFIAYDDEGNQYDLDPYARRKMKMAFGRVNDYEMSNMFKLLVGAPIKVRIQFTGVPESAESFRRIQFGIICGAWGLNVNKPVIIMNVPITHDGD